MIAIRRSRGESMTRVATTPAALHPSPMHIVRACLPCAPTNWKGRSRLKATRGRYPRSSRIVKSGKKIIMGGSITATTQATVRYIPSTNMPLNQPGAPSESTSPFKAGYHCPIRRWSRNLEGTLAPSIVIHSTTPSTRIMAGIPVHRLVRIRSTDRSKSRRRDWPGFVTRASEMLPDSP